MIPAGQYADKLATLLASDDLPDIVQLQGRPPRMPQLLKAMFADLTEHLSGDAAKKYPNLANILERSWKTTVFNGGIYGIPIPREAAGLTWYVRKDLLDKLGLSIDIKNADDFVKLCREITDGKRRWALNSAGSALGLFQRMLKAPNTWREEGRQAHQHPRGRRDPAGTRADGEDVGDGLIHPDAFAEAPPFKQRFGSGRS